MLILLTTSTVSAFWDAKREVGFDKSVVFESISGTPPTKITNSPGIQFNITYPGTNPIDFANAVQFKLAPPLRKRAVFYRSKLRGLGSTFSGQTKLFVNDKLDSEFLYNIERPREGEQNTLCGDELTIRLETNLNGKFAPRLLSISYFYESC